MITDDLAALIRTAVQTAGDTDDFSLSAEAPPISLEKPNNKQHGDYSCNIALALKKVSGLKDSRDIAARIVKHLPQGDSLIDHIEIAGPGFINFYLKPDWLHDVMLRIEEQDAQYGTNTSRAGEKILIEFVSANPTGPISVVNGRAAALGDVLGNLLTSQGAAVAREFYINDALNSLQLEKFARSVEVRYLQHLGYPVMVASANDEDEDILEAGIPATVEGLPTLHFPPDGYRGVYVKDIASDIAAEIGDRYRGAFERYASRHSEPEAGDAPERASQADPFFRKSTLERMVASQRAALLAFGIEFDTWFYESSLYEAGAVEKVIRKLKERDCAYEKDGALWLRSTRFGDEKDRVLIRSNEKATYIAADAAYHDNKFQRGFTRLIDIWGADHHGYVARLKAGVAALDYDPTTLEIILTQMVSLVRDGEAVIGGKRKGNIIELKEDLIDEIGKDAARFYFLLNSYETPATVDVELAKKQSNDNPVYYVQYAHARLCNIMNKAEETGYKLMPASEVDRSLLTEPAELEVLRRLSDFGDEVNWAARDYAPHRLTRYAMELAGLLNVFYENCRVLPGKDVAVPSELTVARLALVNDSRIVLRNLLTLLGISAPAKM